MTNRSPHDAGFETALRDFARLHKAVRYYPPRHPALEAAAAGARHSFARLVPPDGHFLLTVRREGFLQGDQPIASEQPALKKLAAHLFARRVQTLLFLPDVNGRDLHTFARCLALEPSAIQSLGGITEVLTKARVLTLWVNETDLARIHSRREELEAADALPGENDQAIDDLFDEGEQEEDTDEEKDLATVLKELRRTESDQHYRQLAQELVQLMRPAPEDLDPFLALDAFLLLNRDTSHPNWSTLRQGLARQTLDQLASDDLLDRLIDFLCTKGVTEETRRDLNQVLGLFPEKNIPRMMERLATEGSLQSRRHLLEGMTSFGPPAVPYLNEFLDDARWFVIRNAVAVLGEIRAPESAAALPPLLYHRDIRVARETIRALTKIGGSRAVNILLPLVEGEHEELSRQALLSLGAMKNQAAVPTLLKLVSRRDPFIQQAELKKGAIKALGEIGAAEAVPVLAAILGERKWWRRSQFDQMRVAAAAALGEIGGSDSLQALVKAAEDSSPPVARAAAFAMKQIRKSE